MTNEVQTLSCLDGARFVRIARREKRPVGRDWPYLATGDVEEVEAWLRAGSNVGLLLGEPSGLVDVEYDDAAGLAMLQALGLDSIDTPTWSSGRGHHRLFRWSPEMASVGWRKVEGVEFRIGGNPAQSVLPPSVHPSGIHYQWLRSPVDCPPAELPDDVMEFVR